MILFGLSMDYHVFILSRVKERVDAGESTEDAVAHAISKTAGTITSAALVMVGVFALFATIRLLPIKQLGIRARGRGASSTRRSCARCCCRPR